MQGISRMYKGYHLSLFLPERTEPGKTNGRVHITSGEADIGIRFTPDWPQPPTTPQQAEEWLFAYAAGIIDCELAGGLGIDLRHE